MEKTEHDKNNDEKLALLFEFSTVPSFAYDPASLRLTTVNDRALRYYGYSREEFLSLTLDQLVDPTYMPALQQSLSEQELFNMDLVHIASQGRRLDVHVTDRTLAIPGHSSRAVQVQALDVIELHQQALSRQIDALLDMVSTMVRMRDPFTDRHQFRVAALVTAMVHEMGLAPDVATGIVTAAVVHDLGKQSVPIEILLFAGRLSPAAMEVVKGHSQAGHDLLEAIELPWPVAQMALEHHERLDGSGYPHGKIGEETLLGSRVIAVADTAEAMMSYRPYRAALGHEPTLSELTSGQGVRYDEESVSACIEVIGDSDFHFPDGVL